jgi:hypothetical protein
MCLYIIKGYHFKILFSCVMISLFPFYITTVSEWLIKECVYLQIFDHNASTEVTSSDSGESLDQVSTDQENQESPLSDTEIKELQLDGKQISYTSY